MKQDYVFKSVARHDYEVLCAQFEEEFGKEPSKKFEEELLNELAGYTFSELVGKVVNRDHLPYKAWSRVTNTWVFIERRGGRTPRGPKEKVEVVIFERPRA